MSEEGEKCRGRVCGINQYFVQLLQAEDEEEV
jgi:hypothetical protein